METGKRDCRSRTVRGPLPPGQSLFHPRQVCRSGRDPGHTDHESRSGNNTELRCPLSFQNNRTKATEKSLLKKNAFEFKDPEAFILHRGIVLTIKASITLHANLSTEAASIAR